MIRVLKTGYDNLQPWGLVAAFLVLSFGSRTFWDTERFFIPHVFEFNMYLFSISADDDSDLADITIINNGIVLPLDKGAILDSALGYLHLSDRWELYPPLYTQYFCSSSVARKLGYKLSGEDYIEISFTKNYSEKVLYRQKIECSQ
jgi:hypothetical protein